MAEALARKYGSDVLTAASAGVSAMNSALPITREVLREINVDLENHNPRRFGDINLQRYDLIVNMSGRPLPENLGVLVEEWDVKDPYGGTEDDFRRARGDIEMLVMRLILRLRTGKLVIPRRNPSPPIDSGRASSRR